jgi:hypothetical protein
MLPFKRHGNKNTNLILCPTDVNLDMTFAFKKGVILTECVQ